MPRAITKRIVWDAYSTPHHLDQMPLRKQIMTVRRSQTIGGGVLVDHSFRLISALRPAS